MIKLLKGKGYIALRIGNLCLGIGRPSDELREQADLSRANRGL